MWEVGTKQQRTYRKGMGDTKGFMILPLAGWWMSFMGTMEDGLPTLGCCGLWNIDEATETRNPPN